MAGAVGSRKACVPIVQAENQSGGVGQIEQRSHPERVNELAGPEVAKFVHVECLLWVDPEAAWVLVEDKIRGALYIAQAIEAREQFPVCGAWLFEEADDAL